MAAISRSAAPTIGTKGNARLPERSAVGVRSLFEVPLNFSGNSGLQELAFGFGESELFSAADDLF